jgi:hypothetical protein
LQPLSPIIARQLDMSMQAMTVALGMANAACAIGTVFAVRAGALRRAPDLPSSSHAYLVGDVTRSALRGREDKAARMLRLGR